MKKTFFLIFFLFSLYSYTDESKWDGVAFTLRTGYSVNPSQEGNMALIIGDNVVKGRGYFIIGGNIEYSVLRNGIYLGGDIGFANYPLLPVPSFNIGAVKENVLIALGVSTIVWGLNFIFKLPINEKFSIEARMNSILYDKLLPEGSYGKGSLLLGTLGIRYSL